MMLGNPKVESRDLKERLTRDRGYVISVNIETKRKTIITHTKKNMPS